MQSNIFLLLTFACVTVSKDTVSDITGHKRTILCANFKYFLKIHFLDKTIHFFVNESMGK